MKDEERLKDEIEVVTRDEGKYINCVIQQVLFLQNKRAIH